MSIAQTKYIAAGNSYSGATCYDGSGRLLCVITSFRNGRISPLSFRVIQHEGIAIGSSAPIHRLGVLIRIRIYVLGSIVVHVWACVGMVRVCRRPWRFLPGRFWAS